MNINTAWSRDINIVSHLPGKKLYMDSVELRTNVRSFSVFSYDIHVYRR